MKIKLTMRNTTLIVILIFLSCFIIPYSDLNNNKEYNENYNLFICNHTCAINHDGTIRKNSNEEYNKCVKLCEYKRNIVMKNEE